MTTRRTFLSTGSMAVAVALGKSLPFANSEMFGSRFIETSVGRKIIHGDVDLKALARRALEAATAAGASYADVRFTVTRERRVRNEMQGSNYSVPPFADATALAVGVRALANGAWGFAADTVLTEDEMDWLGHMAAENGKTSAWPGRPQVTLTDKIPVATGTWEMPGVRDPFTVSPAEHRDALNAIHDAVKKQKNLAVALSFIYVRQERTFASTDGAFTTQTVYTTFSRDSLTDEASAMVLFHPDAYVPYRVPSVTPGGMGFEVFAQEKYQDRIAEFAANFWMGPTPKALDGVGRFNVVFDAYAMAAIISAQGTAFQLDRALGYTANEDGMSYLAPPDKVLGTSPFSQAVTITANRSLAGGAATVKWDDEGVVAEDYPLVKKGVMVDYVTSREFVPELAQWYKKQGQSAHSRGGAGSGSALSLATVQNPNLRLQPGEKDLGFDELLAGVDDGIAVLGGTVTPDQQQLNFIGGAGASFYRIKKGKLGNRVKDSRYFFRTPDLWKDVIALGGARSTTRRGMMMEKGFPARQYLVHTVEAVPARFQNVVVRPISR